MCSKNKLALYWEQFNNLNKNYAHKINSKLCLLLSFYLVVILMVVNKAK